MGYSGAMTSGDWRTILQSKSQAFIGVIDEGNTQYKKWYDLTYGKTMAQVATMLGVDEAEATAMNQAFNAINEMHIFFYGTAASAQSDRKAVLVKFY